MAGLVITGSRADHRRAPRGSGRGRPHASGTTYGGDGGRFGGGKTGGGEAGPGGGGVCGVTGETPNVDTRGKPAGCAGLPHNASVADDRFSGDRRPGPGGPGD